jgi:hypothetical protein
VSKDEDREDLPAETEATHTHRTKKVQRPIVLRIRLLGSGVRSTDVGAAASIGEPKEV